MPASIARYMKLARHPAAGGAVLAAAAVLALAWANSPWAAAYEQLWRSPARFVVNDILMAVFFLLVGLEIRREVHDGQLRTLRRATLPIVAALGGMVAPAVIFLALVNGDDAVRGWGIPMATDIAFAVGVLALLGRRLPPGARVFLLALAIIDDVGAIVVIAVAYSGGIAASGLAIAAAGVAAILVLRRRGVEAPLAYVLPAIVIWYGMLAAGIHPTLAGVIVGLLAPVRARTPGTASTAARVEATLHPWVTFAIMPLFALANAGVAVGELDFGGELGLLAGIAIALVGGKLVGIALATLLAVKLRAGVLPDGVGARELAIVGALAGIGFTMALFIAELAYPERPDLHAVAKLAVLVASLAAGLLAVVAARVLMRDRGRRRGGAAAARTTAPGSGSRTRPRHTSSRA